MKRALRIGLLAAGVATVLAAGRAQTAEEKWTPLFNGKDFSGWKLRKRGPNGWKIAEGALQNTPPGEDLVTEKEYLNFRLRYEYRCWGNSGVGLRGRYEIQIDDSYGKPADKHGNGAIYSQLAPARNVSRKAGEWQTIEATLVGKRITVIHNGVKTVDNYELPGPTGIQYDDRLERAAGPIILQGDHGRVDFRKLEILPLP